MIIMPNNKAIINTRMAVEITKKVAFDACDATMFADAENWHSEVMDDPDFISIDNDGDVHLTYVVVTHIDPGDDMEEIGKGFFANKKACKKMLKEFIDDFRDEYLIDGTYACVDIMFLVTDGASMGHGKVRGCTLYDRKVKPRE